MGIIGGADGPASIIVAHSFVSFLPVMLYLALGTLAFIILLKLLKILPKLEKVIKIYIEKNSKGKEDRQ